MLTSVLVFQRLAGHQDCRPHCSTASERSGLASAFCLAGGGSTVRTQGDHLMGELFNKVHTDTGLPGPPLPTGDLLPAPECHLVWTDSPVCPAAPSPRPLVAASLPLCPLSDIVPCLQQPAPASRGLSVVSTFGSGS